jgi:hypothetical protein
MLGYAFVSQGTGVVDPADFTNSTIDLLDVSQNPIATVLVAGVVRAYTDDEWDMSQKIAANDALYFTYDITPYPNAKFYTNWTPNKASGTPYTSVKTSGFYEAIPADLTLQWDLHRLGFGVQRFGTRKVPRRKYIGGEVGYQILAEELVEVVDHRAPESWDRFKKRVTEERAKIEAAKKEYVPLTHTATIRTHIAAPIPRNTLWIDVTVKSPVYNKHASFQGFQLRVKRSKLYQHNSSHAGTVSEALDGTPDPYGAISMFSRHNVFRNDNDNTFRLRYMVIANTHPRVGPDKTAYYTVWHTEVESIMLPQGFSVISVDFEQTGILTMETEPNGIHAEAWRTEPGFVLPSREIRDKMPKEELDALMAKVHELEEQKAIEHKMQLEQYEAQKINEEENALRLGTAPEQDANKEKNISLDE